MQIKYIVLYDYQNRRRELEFNVNGVSIVAGDSATGKSSLIEIIDYCLGAGECRVPDGVIRETVEWYALKLISKHNGEMFVARRTPNPGRQTSEAFLIRVGNSVAIPDGSELAPTHNLKSAINAISFFLGMRPNVTESETGDRKGYDITIRHAIKFCLQYQDEIASKRTLFHQQGESFKARSIYDSLPYLLGLQEDDYLDRLARLKQAKKELAYAQRRLDEYKALAAIGFDSAAALIVEAKHVGILSGPSPPPSTTEELLKLLDSATKWSPDAINSVIASDDQITESQQRLMQLEQRRHELKSQLLAVENANRLVDSTAIEWNEQSSRLSFIELYGARRADGRKCPLCEQDIAKETEALPKVESVLEQMLETNLQLTNLQLYSPDLTEYQNTLRSSIVDMDAQITGTRQTIRRLQLDRDDVTATYDLTVRQAIVAGKILQYLDAMRDRLGEGNSLSSAVVEAEARVKDLEDGIRASDIRNQLIRISNELQGTMTRSAIDLSLEFAPHPFRIDFENLTVEVNRNGDALPLYRMGSGKNWLGCHLIAHFALHAYFIANNRPVPRFLVLDQPTQVFYPPDKVDAANGEIEFIHSESESEDRDIVQRMFNWIFQQTAILNDGGNFQVIITDHAELRTGEFEQAQIDLPRWRPGGNSLIPNAWT